MTPVSPDEWHYSDDWGGSIERVIYREGVGLPDCVVDEGTRCIDCPFGDPRTCPLLQDPDLRSYLSFRGERALEYYQDREEKIAALRRVFRKHRLPLHWEIVARIARDEAPDLFSSPDSVRSLLFFNRDFFRHKGGGVFELSDRQA